MNVRKINNIKIIPPLHNSGLDNKPVLGSDYLSEPYQNIAILGRKNSGKSSAVYTLLKNCVGKSSNVWIISSTVNKDPLYKTIIEMLEKKGVIVNTFDDLEQDGEDVLKMLMDEFKRGDEPVLKVEEPKNMLFPQTRKLSEVKRKPREPKFLYPKHTIVIDDMGDAMRNKSLSQLMRINRHLHTRLILVCHNLKNIINRSQIDVCMVFNGFNDDEKLMELYNDLNISLSFSDFKEVYKYATKERYNFLYINTRDDIFRKNFDEEITFL